MKPSGLPLSVHSVRYVERLYSLYRRDAGAVPEAWRNCFKNQPEPLLADEPLLGPSFKPRSLFNPAPAPAYALLVRPSSDRLGSGLGERLQELIRQHRVRGHLIANIDPLGASRPVLPELELEHYAFSDAQLESLTVDPTLPFDQPLTVREIFQRLRRTYCHSIGVQFMHIEDAAARQWLQQRMERTQNQLSLTPEEQRRVLTRLIDGVVFEKFIRTKFLGAKTFSLEGNEALLPLLELAIHRAAGLGVRDIVIGMAHRGRLNVRANIMGQEPGAIFRELADRTPGKWLGRGDVRYHLGYSGDWTTKQGERIHLSLCSNPSHVEFVNPVVLGRVRARQDRSADQERRQVLALLIHGDAALAGEGIVQETLNFSRLPGYRVGGVLHVVTNNQLGFTTPPSEGRSSRYATDIALLLQIPIFHVNGEDASAVAQVVRLALDFRAEFRSDVFIDLYGYRRWGHNETDEPSFTQPVLYRAIEQHEQANASGFGTSLGLDALTAADAKAIAEASQSRLEQEFARAGTEVTVPPQTPSEVWAQYRGGPEPTEEPETGVPAEQLAGLLLKLTELPQGFALHPKLERGWQKRRQIAEGYEPLDWSTAEVLALASLAMAGHRVRLAGQDTARGTFSQRHAILYDQQDGSSYVPLQHLTADQAPVEVLNSPLNEAGALGFEYGYSLDAPDALVLWEAQFGDFINAAQVIVDQFISAAEDKWERLSGLVLLLPHGFEGMGPEHSSARLERFLALAAEHNLQIVQPTTPAQYFHCLRRQQLRPWRKPLVVLTPKSLLRHRLVVSELADCAHGHFQRILRDPAETPAVRRVLLCTGKIYYELAAYRHEHQRTDVALLRLEQLYPLRDDLLELALTPYPSGTAVFWVQEEPENMGAWRYLRCRFGETLFGRMPLRRVSRPESASPATGSARAHQLEQAELIQAAFGDQPPPDALPPPSKPPSRNP